MASSEKTEKTLSRLPSLIVFDLDECVWSPEMYTLNKIPTSKDAVVGDLPNDVGRGVVGCRSGSSVIRIFPGAIQAFQRLLQGEYGENVRVAAASSADTPRAVKIARASMKVLEVLPGITLEQAFLTIGGGFGDDRNLQIGRTPPLSSSKVRSHFPILREKTGISYDEMIFFDDCNWTDHCAQVSKLGVTTQRTPHGMQADEWENALKTFASKS